MFSGVIIPEVTLSPITQLGVTDSFGSNFDFQADTCYKLSQIISEGQSWIYMLYAYRNCSRAIPQLSLTDPNKEELNKQAYKVIHPLINKLQGLMRYQADAAQRLQSIITQMMEPSKKTQIWTDDLLLSLATALDVLMTIDHIKDLRASLINDFATYRRCYSYIKAAQTQAERARVEAEHAALHFFLSTRSSISKNLVERIARAPPSGSVLLAAVTAAKNGNGTHQSSHIPNFLGLRAAAYLPALLDAAATAKLGSSGGPGRKLNPSDAVCSTKFIDTIFSDLKDWTIIPLFSDIHVTAASIFSMLGQQEAAEKLGFNTSSRKEELARRYLFGREELAVLRKRTRHAISELVSAVESDGDSSSPSMPSASASAAHTDSEHGFLTLRSGYRLLLELGMRIANTVAFKLEFPVDVPQSVSHEQEQEQEQDDGGDGDKKEKETESDGATSSSPPTTSLPALSPYERAIPHNLTAEEKLSLAEAVALLKSLSHTLSQCYPTLRHMALRATHDRLQVFIQQGVRDATRSAIRHKKPKMAAILVMLRDIAAHWADGTAPASDPSLKGKKDGDFVLVPPSAEISIPNVITFLVRGCVRSILVDMDAKGARILEKAGISDRKASWLNDFMADSQDWQLLLKMEPAIANVSDVSYLVQREFFQDLEGLVCFPIHQSLPWLLVKECLQLPQPPKWLLLPFMVYDDAASAALTKFKSQHLYEEVETEVGLAFDELVFHLATTSEKVAVSHAILDSLDLDYGRQIDTKLASHGTAILCEDYPSRVLLGHKSTEPSSIRDILPLPLSEEGLAFFGFRGDPSSNNLTMIGRTFDLENLVLNRVGAAILGVIHAQVAAFSAAPFSAVYELRSTLNTLRMAYNRLNPEKEGLPPFGLLLKDALGVGPGQASALSKLAVSKLENEISIHSASLAYFRLGSADEDPSLKAGWREHDRLTKLHTITPTAVSATFIGAMNLVRNHISIDHFAALLELGGLSTASALGKWIVEKADNVVESTVFDLAPLFNEIRGTQTFDIDEVAVSGSGDGDDASAPSEELIDAVVEFVKPLLMVEDSFLGGVSTISALGNLVLISMLLDMAITRYVSLDSKSLSLSDKQMTDTLSVSVKSALLRALHACLMKRGEIKMIRSEVGLDGVPLPNSADISSLGARMMLIWAADAVGDLPSDYSLDVDLSARFGDAPLIGLAFLCTSVGEDPRSKLHGLIGPGGSSSPSVPMMVALSGILSRYVLACELVSELHAISTGVDLKLSVPDSIEWGDEAL